MASVDCADVETPQNSSNLGPWSRIPWPAGSQELCPWQTPRGMNLSNGRKSPSCQVNFKFNSLFFVFGFLMCSGLFFLCLLWFCFFFVLFMWFSCKAKAMYYLCCWTHNARSARYWIWRLQEMWFKLSYLIELMFVAKYVFSCWWILQFLLIPANKHFLLVHTSHQFPLLNDHNVVC